MPSVSTSRFENFSLKFPLEVQLAAAELSRLSQLIIKDSETITKLREEASEYRRRLDNLNREKAQDKKKIDALENDLRATQQEASEYRRRLDNLNSEKAQDKKKIDALKNDLRATQQEQNQDTRQRKNLKKQKT